MARSIFCSSFRWPSEFREQELQVSDLPPSTRRAPKAHTLSLARPYSRGTLMRSPSSDYPGAGGKARGVTGPSSSTQTTVESGRASVWSPRILDLLGRTQDPRSAPTAECFTTVRLRASGCASGFLRNGALESILRYIATTDTEVLCRIPLRLPPIEGYADQPF